MARAKKDDDSVYVHPDTGEETEIPEGSVVYRNDDGEITGWSNPPVTPEGELADTQVEDYEPHFERTGPTRRVMGFITDEEHMGRPRNTLEAIADDLADDPNSPFGHGQDDQVQEHLSELEEAGLVEQREDGTWALTEAGLVEGQN